MFECQKKLPRIENVFLKPIILIVIVRTNCNFSLHITLLLAYSSGLRAIKYKRCNGEFNIEFSIFRTPRRILLIEVCHVIVRTIRSGKYLKVH